MSGAGGSALWWFGLNLLQRLALVFATTRRSVNQGFGSLWVKRRSLSGVTLKFFLAERAKLPAIELRLVVGLRCTASP